MRRGIQASLDRAGNDTPPRAEERPSGKPCEQPPGIGRSGLPRGLNRGW